MVLWKQTRNILLSLPEQLLAEVDAAAKQVFMSRTAYIRAVLQKEVGGKYPEVLDRIEKNKPRLFLDLDDS